MKINITDYTEILEIIERDTDTPNILSDYFLDNFDLFEKLCEYFDDYDDDIIINYTADEYLDFFKGNLKFATLKEIKKEYPQIKNFHDFENATDVYFVAEIEDKEIIAFDPSNDLISSNYSKPIEKI